MKISSSLRTKLAVGAALAALSAISLSGTPTEALTVQLSDHSAEAQKRAEMEQLIAKVNGLSWQGAGGQGNLAQEATIKIDPGLKFLPPPDSSTFLQLQKNPPQDNIYILSRTDYQWFAAFSFDPTGYVKDDEKIDPAALLAQLKEQNAKAIEERKRLNLPILTLEGWYVQPHYDRETKRLEWGTTLLDEDGRRQVNYTVRILGRQGVMSAMLISSPETFDRDLIAFRNSLKSFSYDSGQSYAEFKQGDKVAAYGLGALVVGGAAAVALKSGAGFLKVIWVAIAGAGAAVAGFFRRIFGRKKT